MTEQLPRQKIHNRTGITLLSNFCICFIHVVQCNERAAVWPFRTMHPGDAHRERKIFQFVQRDGDRRQATDNRKW